jgi:hypothetical protein
VAVAVVFERESNTATHADGAVEDTVNVNALPGVTAGFDKDPAIPYSNWKSNVTSSGNVAVTDRVSVVRSDREATSV